MNSTTTRYDSGPSTTAGAAPPALPGHKQPAIFLMCDSFRTGGIERQFNMLARAMRDNGYKVLLGCLQGQGAFLDGLGEVEEFPTGGSFYSWTSVRSRVRLASFLRAHNVKVAQAFDFYSNLMMVGAARLARVPAVIASQNQLGDLLSPMQNRAEILNFRWCDRVVCNSRAAADRLVRLGFPSRKLVVIPNGIDDALELAEPALPREAGRVRVALIGRMNSEVKNHRLFLNAAAIIAHRHPEVEFVLAGDGPLRPALEQQTRDLGIERQVRFMGDRRDVPAVLAAVDVSVVPSKTESLSNVALESMAAGKPVIASNVGGLPEVIVHGKTGLLVAAGDEGELASAIELLITRPDLRDEYGREARKFILTNFSAARLRDEHVRLYDQLLCRGDRQAIRP